MQDTLLRSLGRRGRRLPAVAALAPRMLLSPLRSSVAADGSRQRGTTRNRWYVDTEVAILGRRVRRVPPDHLDDRPLLGVHVAILARRERRPVRRLGRSDDLPVAGSARCSQQARGTQTGLLVKQVQLRSARTAIKRAPRGRDTGDRPVRPSRSFFLFRDRRAPAISFKCNLKIVPVAIPGRREQRPPPPLLSSHRDCVPFVAILAPGSWRAPRRRQLGRRYAGHPAIRVTTVPAGRLLVSISIL